MTQGAGANWRRRSRRPPNHPAAGNAGIASRLAIERHWPGVPEPGRSLWMNPLTQTLMLLLAISSVSADERQTPSIVELPRPNSGSHSFQQAEGRKSEILSNAPTRKLENWKNPYMGFCIHIGTDDKLTVYGHWLKRLPEYGELRGQSVADIKRLTDALPLEGNPAGVLITSELPLKDSKVIHELLKILFVPSVQLFYARSSEPNRAANPSQPVGSETNRTSSAGDSRR